MINQTSLSDPEVPQGGTIRETINWEASVPDHGIATHNFYLLSIYGSGTTEADILANMVSGAYIILTVVSESRVGDYIDNPIAADAPLGTFSCATFIAEDFDGTTIIGVYDSKVDVNVLTITPGLGATIISTSFSSI